MADQAIKHPAIQEVLDALSKATFGRSRSESIAHDTCVKCGGEAKLFNDVLCKREYQISGLCQKCQDSIFGGADGQG